MPEKTGENQAERDESGRFLPGASGNPKGKPKGTLSFATKWHKFIDKVATDNNIEFDEVEQQLLTVAYKNAKNGDYNFYKDIFDRVYGKANQQVSLDVTTKGKSIQAAAIEQLTNEIDDEEEAEIEKAYDEIEEKTA